MGVGLTSVQLIIITLLLNKYRNSAMHWYKISESNTFLVTIVDAKRVDL